MTNSEKVAAPKFGRGAEVRAASYNEADNSIEVVWTTGAAVRRRDWRNGGYYSEVLEVTPQAVRMGRLNAGAPFLDTHDDWSLRSVIGAVVPGSAKIENGRGIARVALSEAAGDADVISKIRTGIIRNVSVGYAIHRVEKTENADADDEWRVVDWEPMEISAVPIPADAGSQIRGADEHEADCVIVTHTADTTARKDDGAPMTDPIAVEAEAVVTEDTNLSSITPQEEPRVADTNTPETRAAPAALDNVRATKAAADEAVRADRERAVTIRKLAKDLGVVDLGAEHVDKGTGVDEFRVALLDHLATEQERTPTSGAIRAEVGEEHREKRAALLQDALIARAGGKPANEEGAREYRGFTLLDMAREALDLQGTRTRGMSREEISQRALQQRSGYHSTSDFSVILGNVINTTLRAGYEAAPQTFRPFIREATVSDFKEVHRAQLGEGPAFDKVNEHGEFKRGSVTEGKESYKVATYGKVLAITRQVIINDDMNAFGRIPQLMGGAAAQLESDLVWHAILSNPVMGDSVALFHATHKNLPTAAAFSVAALGVARALMAKQTGLDGKTVLNIRPQYLIVPVALETKAEQELSTTFYPDTSDKAATASMRSLNIIAEARLDNGVSNPAVGANVAGSATAWYLSASPGQIDTVELAYLEGQRGLFMESRFGFDVDGLEVKARLDVGAKTMDHRGLLKNAGA
jgi:hypothetical protein